MPNLNLIRVQTKLDELFRGKIDLSDVTNQNEKENKFYTRALAAMAIVMSCGIDYEVAAKSVTDDYHDMGIDAIYNDAVQNKLVLVQSKWRTDGTGSISQEEAHTFEEGINRIINLDLDGSNRKIRAKEPEISAAIRDMNYQIECVFCHTGSQKMNAYALRPIDDLRGRVNIAGSTDLLVFSEVKLQEIYEFLANGQNGDNIILNDVVLNNWGMIDNPFKAYYGTISASTIGEWYNQYGNRLFAKNIRYYKGSTEVNQGIKEVLKNEPENFFYYNNGIKLLCKKITKKILHGTTREMGLFALEGVSLVNGAQTAGTIGTVYEEAPESLTTAYVLIQMIDLGTVDEEKATQITKLSNTQNRIDGKDFAALDPNQERLRMELSFAGIQYLYKAGARLDNLEHQITLDEAIIAQACSSGELSVVALAKGNVGALTENIDKTPYKLIFNGRTNSFSVYNGVQVLRAVDRLLKEHEAIAIGRKKLVLVHGNRFLLYRILEKVKCTDGFNDQYLGTDNISDLVSRYFQEQWDRAFEAMETQFPDAYPAYLFRNVGRLRQLVEIMDKANADDYKN